MQFAVEFGVSISRGPDRKMVSAFHVNLPKCGLLTILGGIHGFFAFTMYANGVDFASFII